MKQPMREGHDIDQPDIEAERRGHPAVLRCRAQHDAELGVIDRRPEHHRRDDADADDHEIVGGIEQAADAHDRQHIHQRVGRKRRSAPHEAHQVLEDLQQAEGDQQLVFLGAAIERAQQQRLDDDPDQRHRQRADRQQQEQPAERHASAMPRPTSQAVT